MRLTPFVPRPVLAAAQVAIGLGTSTGAAAQTPETAEFDADRAFVADETIFEPFRVVDADLEPLADALEAGRLEPGTWLLVLEHEAGPLALVMDQLAYHHVAQGQLMGEPWMVSF